MDENQIKGGSGPALAAHSKDASVPGATPASSATGTDAKQSPSATGTDAGQSSGVSDTISKLSGQAREAAGRLGSSVADAAGTTRQNLSEQGSRAADQVETFVREQPFVALALTGAVALALGLLLGRR